MYIMSKLEHYYLYNYIFIGPIFMIDKISGK